MGISNCDNIIRSDKTLELGFKMTFFVLKKCKFPPIICKMPTKTHFFGINLKIHPTKQENAFENMNYISFITWTVTENPNFRIFVEPLAREKIEQLNFGCKLLFPYWAVYLNNAPQNWGNSKNWKKKLSN